jgi:RND family efflux transporter MFP subunit
MNDTIQQRPKSKWRWLRIIVNFLVCIIILGAAVAAVVIINQTEPTAKKINTTRKSAALVETTTVQRGTYSPKLRVLGTVQSAQDIVLSPRVSGQVIEMASDFVPGGMVYKGDLLLRIDPADYENALSISKSELEQSEASREIELARQELAKKELKMLEGTIDDTNRSLVLREPQIASIEAEVSAAKAAVERAKLDLERTSIYAPFDAQVLTRSVNIGSQVTNGDELGTLIGLDQYWIMATVPVRSLRWVQFPKLSAPGKAGDPDVATSKDAVTGNLSADVKGSKVILRNQDAWGKDVYREARVARMIGTLDQQTRLARVLITVDDPLGYESDVPPLILETLIETEIHARPIEDVVRLQREYVRDKDTVWLMKDDKLEIRQIDVEFRDAQYAYIRSGLETGDEVVTTTLATVAEGVGLRKINVDSVGDAPSSNESADSEATE